MRKDLESNVEVVVKDVALEGGQDQPSEADIANRQRWNIFGQSCQMFGYAVFAGVNVGIMFP